MKKIQIFAVLFISCLYVPSSWGRSDEFQLQLGEIDTDEVQLQTSAVNEYILKISQPNAQLVEEIAVERLDSGEAVITKTGNVIVNYPNDNLNSVLNYKADSKGYRASYRLVRGQSEQTPLDFNVRLNIKDLKSLTG